MGVWVHTQRRTKDSLSTDRRQRLEAIGFVWAYQSAKWEEGFSALEAYKRAEGDCLVSRTHRKDNGFSLGTWVGTQRRTKDSLSTDRRQRLEAIGFVWDAHSANWEAGFSALEAYKQAKGDCSVPKGYKAADGLALGSWVATQRRIKDSLPADRKHRLEAIGFVWGSRK